MANSDDEWDTIQETHDSGLKEVGSGALRITLLFGSAAVAFALFLVPILNRNDAFSFGSRTLGQSLDRMATGSVSRDNAYVVRRSVLQNSPNAICVIRSNGNKSGDC